MVSWIVELERRWETRRGENVTLDLVVGRRFDPAADRLQADRVRQSPCVRPAVPRRAAGDRDFRGRSRAAAAVAALDLQAGVRVRAGRMQTPAPYYGGLDDGGKMLRVILVGIAASIVLTLAVNLFVFAAGAAFKLLEV